MSSVKIMLLGLAIVLAIAAPAIADDEPNSSPSNEGANEFRITQIDGVGVGPAGSRRGQGKATPGAVDGYLKIHFSKATDLSALRSVAVVLPVAPLAWNKASQEDDQIIKVPGTFQPGVPYALVLTRPLKDREEKFEIEPGRHPFKIEMEKESIRFLGQGTVLEKESRQVVHLALRGVERVRLEALRVPVHALVPVRTAAPSKESDKKRSNGHKNGNGTVTSALPTTASLATVADEWNRRSAELAKTLSGHTGPFAGLFDGTVAVESEPFFEPGPDGKEHRCSLPLAWRKTAKEGATYLIGGRSVDLKDEVASELVALQITDLGLSYKLSKSDLVVWATKLSTGQVVTDARVFLTTRDGKLLFAGKTDADGLLKLAAGTPLDSLDLATRGVPTGKAPLDPSALFRTIVLAGSDLAWVNLDENQIKVPKKVKSGEATLAELTRAHVFTERGIYRPRDTVRFKATVRQFQGGTGRVPDQGAPNASCRVIIKNAKGQVALESTMNLSAFGTVSGSLTTKGSDPLGQWTLTVKDREGKVEWGETTFAVEEFVPPRHKVDVSFKEKDAAAQKGPKDPYTPSRSVIGTISATYYAGGPVKHGKVRWKLSLEGTHHDLKDQKGFVCGTDLPGEPELLESGEAMLGADGTLSVEVPLSPEVLDGRRSLSLAATVLDFDARSATGTGAFSVEPAFLVGLSEHASDVGAEEPVELSAIVVDRATGKRVNDGELTVDVLQEKWTSIQKRNDEGDFFWSWESVMARSFGLSSTIKDGAAPVHVSFTDGGKYQVQVGYKAPDGTVYRTTTTFNVEWTDSDGEGSASKWRAERMRTLTLQPDRLEYVPGETARIRLHLPRPADSYLVSVEREKILILKRVVPKSPAEPIEFQIPDGWLPNVHVSVLAVHGRQGFPVYASDADTGAPGYSHGYLTLPVRHVHPGLKVALTGAGESVSTEPGLRHKVGLTVTDKDGKPVEAEVALAVVDESVLALTAFQTPTLEELFKVILPLLVRTGDLRTSLALQTPFRALTVLPLTGGDGADGHASKTREWFDPVAFFQPDIVTDANGKAEVEFTVPDTMTTYRVYAIACDKGERHGSVARPLLSRKPFYLEAGLPRFFTHEDTGKFFVALFNGTGKEGEARLDVESTGGLELKIAQPTVKLGATDRAQVAVEFRATAPVDAKLKFSAKLGDRTDSVALAVPVRSRYVIRTQVVEGITTKAKDRIELALVPEAAKLSPELAKLASAQLELSTLPALRLSGGLKYLLHYPYGCIEQTSSTVLPLAALRDLIGHGLIPTISLADADKYLTPGIERILSMQVSSGGFGYWPGHTAANSWGSAYAALALTLADKAGAKVPEAEFKKALDYLVSIATGKDESCNHVRAMACYVLALNRRLTGDPLELLKPGRGLGLEDCLLAVLAAAAMGKTKEAQPKLGDLLPEDDGKNQSLFDPYTFGVPERLKALQLLAMLELSPKHKKLAKTAASLFGVMGPEGHWSTTQASAWALMALGRFAAKTPFSDKPLTVNAKAVGLPDAPIAIEAKGVKTVDLDVAPFLAATSVDLSRQGSTPLIYRLSVNYPWRGADVAEADAPVQRTYRRLAGDGPIRVGDLVEVEIALKMSDSQHYSALVDPLPAGLVAVNSTLKTEEQVAPRRGESDEWSVTGEWVCPFIPSHLENRDDRVLAFRDYSWRGKYKFTYVARAVCEGRFMVPPAKFEPMYTPANSEYSTATTFVVEPAGK